MQYFVGKVTVVTGAGTGIEQDAPKRHNRRVCRTSSRCTTSVAHREHQLWARRHRVFLLRAVLLQQGHVAHIGAHFCRRIGAVGNRGQQRGTGRHHYTDQSDVARRRSHVEPCSRTFPWADRASGNTCLALGHSWLRPTRLISLAPRPWSTMV